jgi:hemoglobin/transferrin/lactoferrin receptor protein
MLQKGLFFSICFLSIYYLYGQQNDSTNTLQEVFVTAARKELNWISLPYAATKIKKEQVHFLQLRTAPEALMGQAGVFIQKTNHGGGSPFVRGFTGNQTLLLFDGIRLNNSTYRYGPNQYFNTVDMFNVGSIEVARGTGSVQYGSDAIGGVIQVFSNEIAFTDRSKFYGKGIYRWVSKNTENSFRGESGFSKSNMSFLVGVTNREFGDLPGGDTTGIQTPSGYNERNVDLKFRWKILPTLTVTAFHQQVLQKNVHLYHRVKLENFAYYTFSPQERSLSYIKTEFIPGNKIINKLTVIASLQQNKEQRNYRRNGNVNAFVENDKVNTAAITADILSQFTPTYTTNSGVEWYYDKVSSNRLQTHTGTGVTQLQRGLYPNNASLQQLSLYSLHHISFKSWQIEAGVRYNTNLIRIQDTSTNSNSLGNVNVRPASFVTNLSLLRLLNKYQSIYLSFSTGFRSPNIDDMGTLGLVDFRYEIPAYQLKPENAYNMEAGYRLQYNKQRVGVSLFYMHLNNLINRVQLAGQQINGYNVYIKENSQESYVRGAEFDAYFAFGKGLNVQVNGTYTFGQNISRAEPMRRIPPAFGRLLLEKHWGKWVLAFDQQFAGVQRRLAQGDKDDNRIPKEGTPGWYTANLMLQYQRDIFRIQAGCINIFNADYRTHGSGINGQGRTYSMSFGVVL